MAKPKLYEMAFKIGGALDRSFNQTTSLAGKKLTALQLKAQSLARQQRLAGALGNLSGHFRQLGRAAAIGGAAVAAMGTAAGMALFQIARQTATLGDAAIKTSTALGIEVEALQELWYAAERSGASQRDVETSLRRMSVALGQAAAGTGEARQWLDRMGVSAAHLASLQPDAAFEELATALASIPNAAERAAASQALLGRGAVKLGALIDEGGQGLRRLRAEAQATGSVIGRQAAEDSAKFNDRLLDLQRTMGGLKTTIGAALLPAFTRIFERLAGWLRENRALVQRWADRLSDLALSVLPRVEAAVARWLRADLPRYLSESLRISRLLGGWIARLAAGTVALVERLGGLENVVVLLARGVAAVYAIKLAAWLWSAGAAAWNLAAALAANPIVLLSALLLAHIGLVIAAGVYWDRWTGWLRDAGLAVKVFAGALLWLNPAAWVGLAVAAVIRFHSEIVGALSATLAWVGGFVKRWGVLIVGGLLGPLPLLVAAIWTFWEQIKGFFAGIGTWFFDAGAGLITALVAGIKRAAPLAIAAVTEMAAKVRALLPFSDAKTGPLSQLTQSGAALVRTLGQGVASEGGAPLTRPLSAALSGVPAAAGAGGGRGAPARSLTLTYSPTIHVEGGGDARAGAAAALRAGADDLMLRLRAALEQERRLSYG